MKKKMNNFLIYSVSITGLMAAYFFYTHKDKTPTVVLKDIKEPIQIENDYTSKPIKKTKGSRNFKKLMKLAKKYTKDTKPNYEMWNELNVFVTKEKANFDKANRFWEATMDKHRKLSGAIDYEIIHGGSDQDKIDELGARLEVIAEKMLEEQKRSNKLHDILMAKYYKHLPTVLENFEENRRLRKKKI